jgi:site-specific recombinase XerD
MDIVDVWARSLRAAGRAPATLTNYVNDADYFTLFLAGVELTNDGKVTDRHIQAVAERVANPIEDASRTDIERFLVWSRVERGLADATVARRYRSLTQLFNYLVDIEEADAHPMEKMKPPTMVDKPPPIISDSDMAALVDACKGNLVDGGQRRRNYQRTKLEQFEVRRDTALVEILRTTGVRSAELMNLAMTDINDEAQTFTVLGKGNRIRSIALAPQAAAALDRYRLVRGRHPRAAHPALWLARKGPLSKSGLAQMLRRRSTDAGIVRINPHAFRHTFAHQAKVYGMTDENLMAVAGWQSSQMLQRYGRSASEERAQAAHREMFEGES